MHTVNSGYMLVENNLNISNSEPDGTKHCFSTYQTLYFSELLNVCFLVTKVCIHILIYPTDRVCLIWQQQWNQKDRTVGSL